MATGVQRHMCDFNSQEVNTVWALATAGKIDASVFAALATAAAECLMEDFNPQELANTAWAFARAG